MIDQPTILGFPITPWLIIFFVCLIAIFIGVIMLTRDIKKKDFNVNDVVVMKSDFTNSDSSSTTSSVGLGKTEGLYGTTGTMQTNGTDISNVKDKTSSIYGSGETSSFFEDSSTSSFVADKTEGFGLTETTAFDGTEAFLSSTEFINQTEYTGRIMYCSKCGTKLDGGVFCSKCGTKI